MAKKEQVKLTTPPFIVAFPHILSPDKESKKFGVTAIWRPSEFSEKDKALWAKILASLDADSKAVHKKAYKDLDPQAFKKGIRRGDSKDYEGFGPGTVFANLTSLYRPGVVTINGETVSVEDGNESLLYPGCLCRATVNTYAYTEKGKGVAIGLKNLQIISSDESKYPRLDGRGNAADDFDEDLDSKWLEEGDGDFDGSDFDGGDGDEGY